MPITPCNSVGFKLGLGLLLLITTAMMLTPGPPEAPAIPHIDKLYHAANFLLLGFFADAGWPEKGFVARKYLPLLVYGAAIEWLQIRIPNRTFEWLDIVADGAGLLIYGLIVLPLLYRIRIR